MWPAELLRQLAAVSAARVHVPLVANRAADLGSAAVMAADPLDQFFSLAKAHRIDIAVSEAGIASLLERPHKYVHAAVRIDGLTVEDVGVRLKGGAGSFIPLDGDYPPVSGDGNGKPGKSAFVVDINRYARGLDYLGLEKLTLNNLVQDPSSIHEFIGYALFRAGGVPASRVGYAQLTLNGQAKGLYAMLETSDNDAFLEKWYGTSQGDLYEGLPGVDLRPETAAAYDHDHGPDKTGREIQDLVAALEAIRPGEDPLPVLEQHFDLDEYLAFAATELYLGHWDGYAWSVNNYRLHHSPTDGRWTFLPWGIDQLFQDPIGEYGGVMRTRGPGWGPGGGRIHQLCFASPACRERLHQAFTDLLDRVDEVDLRGLTAEARVLVEPLTLAEAEEYGDPALTVAALDQVSRFIDERRQMIEAWLPCLVGVAVDHDGDTYDGCTLDCSDRDPLVYPGAPERCNLRDDDCNGVIDDPAECPKCIGDRGPDGREYSLCFAVKPWPAARQYCLDHGGDLASFHDPHTAERLPIAFIERVGVFESWIGLSDRATEGAFRWVDGSALDFERWGPDAPRRDGLDTDCVLSGEMGWLDVPCEQPHAFICRSP